MITRKTGRRLWDRFKCGQQQIFQRFSLSNKDFGFQNQLICKNSQIRYKM